MNKIGERISWYKQGDDLVISISGQVEKWKEQLLLLWLLAWTFCGIYVFTELFGPYTRDEKLVMFIYLVFWLYFEYRMSKTLLWRKWGQELLKVSTDEVMLKKDIKSYGKLFTYQRDNIRDLKIISHPPHSFAGVYHNSFWIMGGETLSFEHLGQTVTFGMQLNEQEAGKLKSLVKSQIKKKA